MLISMDAIFIKDMVWGEVHTILKVGVSQHLMNNQPRVTIEDLVDVRHPLWLIIAIGTMYAAIILD